MGGDSIEIVINKQSGVPLYIQVKKQIMNLIRSSSLKVGFKMPTERELSQKLSVSRNTISMAYNELEQEGVIKSYQGRGTFVVEEAETWKVHNIKEKIIRFVDLGFEEALETGMDSDEFLEIVYQRVKEKKELMRKLVAVYVECNGEQAKFFSKQLSKSTNMNVSPLVIDDLRKMDKATKELLERTQVIIATFNHVNEVAELVHDYGKEVLGVAISAEMESIVKIARYPQKSKFGFICLTEEFKFKIRGALEKAGLGNINIEYTNTKDEKELMKVINNSDVLIASPGRYNDVKEHNINNKEVVNFIYSLDYDSVMALKSKIIEIRYKL